MNSERGRSERPGQRKPRQESETAVESLLEMADELEAHGRELLRQARQLQRLADRLERSEGGDRGIRSAKDNRPGNRGPKPDRGRTPGKPRGERTRNEQSRGRPTRAEAQRRVGEERPRVNQRPEWAPRRER
jgi:hypothetical protein